MKKRKQKAVKTKAIKPSTQKQESASHPPSNEITPLELAKVAAALIPDSEKVLDKAPLTYSKLTGYFENAYQLLKCSQSWLEQERSFSEDPINTVVSSTLLKTFLKKGHWAYAMFPANLRKCHLRYDGYTHRQVEKALIDFSRTKRGRFTNKTAKEAFRRLKKIITPSERTITLEGADVKPVFEKDKKPISFDSLISLIVEVRDKETKKG